jgi:hypothetical protein
MAYQFVDLTLVVGLFTAFILALIACTIPSWSLLGIAAPAPFNFTIARVGLWRSCQTINGVKQCWDTASESLCPGLVGAARALMIVVLVLIVLAMSLILLSASVERHRFGRCGTLFITVAMVCALCCWACWLAFSSQVGCLAQPAALGAAFALAVTAFSFILVCSIAAVFVSFTTEGFGYAKTFAGRPTPGKTFGPDGLAGSPPRTPPPAMDPHPSSRAQVYQVAGDPASPPAARADPNPYALPQPAPYRGVRAISV